MLQRSRNFFRYKPDCLSVAGRGSVSKTAEAVPCCASGRILDEEIALPRRQDARKKIFLYSTGQARQAAKSHMQP